MRIREKFFSSEQPPALPPDQNKKWTPSPGLLELAHVCCGPWSQKSCKTITKYYLKKAWKRGYTRANARMHADLYFSKVVMDLLLLEVIFQFCLGKP